MLTLKSLIPKAVNRAGIADQIRSTSAVLAAEKFLDKAMLPDLRKMAHVVSYAQGVIKIHCNNGVTAHEVQHLEAGIINAAKTADPRADVRRVLAVVHSPSAYDV